MQPEAINTTPLKLRRLLDESKRLESPAALYLRKQCGFMPDSRATPYLRQYGILPHWVHGGDFYAALVVKATNELTGNIAAEIIYLTREGELAPIDTPRLLVGALAGASVCVQKENGEFGRFTTINITLRVEDALRLRPNIFPESALIAAIRRDNVLLLPELQSPSMGLGVLLHLRPQDMLGERQAKWNSVVTELRARGFKISISSEWYWNGDQGEDDLL